jgi:hypothetical protein
MVMILTKIAYKPCYKSNILNLKINNNNLRDIALPNCNY